MRDGQEVDGDERTGSTSSNTGFRVDWPATRRKLLDAERELRRLREAVARRRELQKTAAESSSSERAVAPRTCRHSSRLTDPSGRGSPRRRQIAPDVPPVGEAERQRRRNLVELDVAHDLILAAVPAVAVGIDAISDDRERRPIGGGSHDGGEDGRLRRRR